MTTYYKEYPEIQVPAFLDKAPWEDTSWHNDATASSVWDLDCGMEPRSIRVWVNADKVEDRETFEEFKYMVVLEESENGNYIHCEPANTDKDAVALIQKFYMEVATSAIGRQ